jgi:hypothetical protein
MKYIIVKANYGKYYWSYYHYNAPIIIFVLGIYEI